MDLQATIQELQSLKRKLEGIIAELEELQAQDGSPHKRRGRKYMPVEERQEVSRRMSRYWASQRELKAERQQNA